MSDDDPGTQSDPARADDGADRTDAADEHVGGSDAADDGDSPVDTTGAAWLVLGVLVAAVLAVLLVGTAFEEPFAGRAAELAIGFAWLLAATYVGFRLEGSPGLRVAGALAFVVAAVAQFVSLFAASALLSTLRLLSLLAGAAVLLVVVRR